MESVLLVVTAMALAAAAAAGWYAWSLRAEERRRSEARVAALSGAIDAAVHPPRSGHTPVSTHTLFEPEHSAAAHGAPVLRVAAGVVMAVTLLVAVAMSNRGAPGETPEESGARPVSTRQTAPLELVSMRHERDGDALRVTGLVRNPRSGRAASRVTAVVLAFNRAGAYVASGRAPLDFTTLDPGDESPFVVTIPGAADVGRYRVSFRTEAGVVQHVDRRGDQTRLASAR